MPRPPSTHPTLPHPTPSLAAPVVWSSRRRTDGQTAATAGKVSAGGRVSQWVIRQEDQSGATNPSATQTLIRNKQTNNKKKTLSIRRLNQWEQAKNYNSATSCRHLQLVRPSGCQQRPLVALLKSHPVRKYRAAAATAEWPCSVSSSCSCCFVTFYYFFYFRCISPPAPPACFWPPCGGRRGRGGPPRRGRLIPPFHSPQPSPPLPPHVSFKGRHFTVSRGNARL